MLEILVGPIRAGLLPDCCVLLAARTARATAALTFDERLRAAAAADGYATSV